MNLDLNNKNVLVIGGTRGIGLAIANGFADNKSNVIVVSRKIKKFQNNNINHVKADATDIESMNAAKKVILNKMNNRIDIVISNVGDGSLGKKSDESIDNWNESWKINFNTCLHSALIFKSALKNSRGVIIFTSSIAGIEEIGAPTAYSVAKSSLKSLSKSLSFKLAPEIRVNVVAPGNIFFKGGIWDKKQSINPEEVKIMLDTKVPLRRFGKPEEVADLILFLSSPRSSFITGGCFVIDGGQTKTF